MPAAATAGATATWLWSAVVLGLALVLLTGLVAVMVRQRRHRSRPEAAGPEDDLPGFLEFPPGSAAGRPGGWAALAQPPVASPPSPGRWTRRDTAVVGTAMAATAALVGLVAIVAVPGGDRHPRRDRSSATAEPATTARLTFGGVVLEPRAVGVTATYPVVEITHDGERSRARIEFPTFNCLTAEAPADPLAAGCAPGVTEYAELASPDLGVDRDGDGLVVSGRFPTETRPNGSPPAATGQVYEVRITVTPAGPPLDDGSRPARGVLELGSGRAATVDGVSVLRPGA